jgi:hypothetical protein
MLKFWVGISLEGKWRSSASTAKTRPTTLTILSRKRGALCTLTLPHSNAATSRSEAEILVYLQRERAQGMDEL